jgi:hypothetical protein
MLIVKIAQRFFKRTILSTFVSENVMTELLIQKNL